MNKIFKLFSINKKIIGQNFHRKNVFLSLSNKSIYYLNQNEKLDCNIIVI